MNSSGKQHLTIQEAANLCGKSIHTIHYLLKTKKITKEIGHVDGRNIALIDKSDICVYYNIPLDTPVPSSNTKDSAVEQKRQVENNNIFTPMDLLDLEEKLEVKIEGRLSSQLADKDRVIQRLEQQKEVLQGMILSEKGEKGAMAGELGFLREKVVLLEGEVQTVKTKLKLDWNTLGYGIGIIMIVIAFVLFIFWPAIFS